METTQSERLNKIRPEGYVKRFKFKTHLKTKSDVIDNTPYWVSQKWKANIATMADISKIVYNNIGSGVEAQNIIRELSEFFVDYSVQIRLAGNPTFLQTSAGNKFYDEFKKQCSKLEKATVRIRNDQGIEKTGPLGFFTMYHYRNKIVGDNNERL